MLVYNNRRNSSYDCGCEANRDINNCNCTGKREINNCGCVANGQGSNCNYVEKRETNNCECVENRKTNNCECVEKRKVNNYSCKENRRTNCNKGEQMQLLQIITEASFALDDIKLFLDTHPCDKEALKAYEEYKKVRKVAWREYTTQYGPLSAYDVEVCNDSWDWIEKPWPWEGVC